MVDEWIAQMSIKVAALVWFLCILGTGLLSFGLALIAGAQLPYALLFAGMIIVAQLLYYIMRVVVRVIQIRKARRTYD